MEKPRPRTAAARPLIIERPDLQSRPQRMVSAALTAVFWALWLYLWLPVVALLGWAFGFSRFYDEMVRREGYKPLAELLGWYGLAIGLLAGSLVCWAVYNLLRFRGRERRQMRPLVRVAQIAEGAGVDAETLLLWQRARVLSVMHDDDGRIESVEAFSAAAPVAAPATGRNEAGAERLMKDPAAA